MLDVPAGLPAAARPGGESAEGVPAPGMRGAVGKVRERLYNVLTESVPLPTATPTGTATATRWRATATASTPSRATATPPPAEASSRPGGLAPGGRRALNEQPNT